MCITPDDSKRMNRKLVLLKYSEYRRGQKRSKKGAFLAASIKVDIRTQANKMHGMHILTTNTIMKTINTNPALEFYSKLLAFVKVGAQTDGIRDILTLGASEHVSLYVDEETLTELDDEVSRQGDKEMEILEDIVTKCFQDLACQMRNEAARELFGQWVDKAGMPDDLFIHLRKSKDLGDGFAAVSIVTNDIVRYRLYCSHPEKVLYAGKVWRSSDIDTEDPD